MGKYTYGVIFGFLFVSLVLTGCLFRSRKSGKNSGHYDERQNMVRGTGYKISFITVILLNLLYALFFFGPTKDIVSPQFAVIAIVFIGILVYTIYCIFNDAYVQVGQKMTKWIALILFVIISNGYCAISGGCEQGFIVNGLVTRSSVNALITVTFSLVLIAYFIKLAIDKFGGIHEKP